MMSEKEYQFPFVRIVGQDEMKRALLLNIVDPDIGGVLVRGEKGTAKSTTVRSLKQIMPDVVSSDCQFHCSIGSPRFMCDECRKKYEEGTLVGKPRGMRVVELPLNATEDRISGSLDVEYILRTGVKKYEGGVLAQANGNLLYVDEVNLLDDHIVDLLLDSAAMGRNYVEREGISFSHPSRFVLVGTMNPEEGNLRPQLLDRFGMAVDIVGEKDPEVRMEVVRRRLAYDADPEAYLETCRKETEELKQRLTEARENVSSVKVSDKVIHTVAVVAIRFGIEGHRADLALIRAAKANAALEGRDEVVEKDIMDVGSLVLRHRMKAGPFEEAVFRKEDLLRCIRGY